MRDKLKISGRKYFRQSLLSLLEAFLVLPIICVKSLFFVPMLYLVFRFGFHRAFTAEFWYVYILTAFWFQRVPEDLSYTSAKNTFLEREITRLRRRVSRDEAAKNT